MLYIGGKLQQKSKFYVYRNSGRTVGHTEFCLSAVKSLFNGYIFREVDCVVQQLEQWLWFCLHFSPLSHSAFLCCNFLISLFICYHAHHCVLVCDNWCKKKKKVLRLGVFCRRPEGCKKPQKQARETLREVLVQMWIVYLYMYFVDSVPFSLIMFA